MPLGEEPAAPRDIRTLLWPVAIHRVTDEGAVLPLGRSISLGRGRAGTERLLLRFDVTEAAALALRSAFLLLPRSEPDEAGETSLVVRRVAADWAPGSAPQVVASPAVRARTAGGQNLLRVDVTSLLEGAEWQSPTLRSVALIVSGPARPVALQTGRESPAPALELYQPPAPPEGGAGPERQRTSG